MFVLDAAQQRKAALMHRPDAQGDYAFARAMAVQREFVALPTALQQSAMWRVMAAMPHDASCLSPVVQQLMAAMLGRSDPAPN